LRNGEYWFPLGTSAIWPKTGGVTGLYLFVPSNLELSGTGLKRVGSLDGEKVFVREYFMESPSYDLNARVQTASLSIVTDSLRWLVALLIEFCSIFAYVVAFFASVAGGTVFFKRKNAQNARNSWRNAFFDSLRLWVVYVGGALLAVASAAAVVFVPAWVMSQIPNSYLYSALFTLLFVLIALGVWAIVLVLSWREGFKRFLAGRYSFSECFLSLAASWLVGLAFTVVFLVALSLLTNLYYAL
jgi:hypothetical protein